MKLHRAVTTFALGFILAVLVGAAWRSLQAIPPLLFVKAGTACGVVPTIWSDPSGSNTLFAWWVASDFCTNLAVNDTNPWIDRVQSVRLQYETAGVPVFATNLSDGMSFVGVTAILTNTPLAPGSNSTMCIILKPSAVSGSLRYIYGPYSAGDPTQANNSGDFTLRSTRWNWGTVPGFSACAAFVGSTAQVDVAYDVIAKQSNNIMTWFTNGTQSAAITCLPPASGWPWQFLGHDGISAAAPYLGKVLEILIWSNLFSLDQVSNVHYYATNRYGYSP